MSQNKCGSRAVLTVHPSANVSGAAKSWALVVKALKRAGFDVVTSSPGVAPLHSDFHVKIDCPQLGRAVGRIVWYCASFPYYLWLYCRAIRRYRIELVHCNGVYLWQPMLAAVWRRVPLVVHVRECREKYPGFLYRAWVRFAEYFATRIVCVAGRDRENFSREDVKVISNWIDVAEFHSQFSDSTSCQPNLGLPQENHILLVSQLIEGKGHLLAVDIVDELIRKGVDCHLVVAGGTNNNPNNEKFLATLCKHIEKKGLANRIEFLGEVASVLPLMRQYKYVMMPSKAESFSRVYLEAMYSGCILLATDVGAANEIIVDRVNSVLIDRHSPARSAEIIQSIFKDCALQESISTNAYSTVTEKFNDQIHGRAFAALVEAELLLPTR